MMAVATNKEAKGATPDLCDNVEFIVGPNDVTPEMTAKLEADRRRNLMEGRKLMLEEKLEAERSRRAKARS